MMISLLWYESVHCSIPFLIIALPACIFWLFGRRASSSRLRSLEIESKINKPNTDTVQRVQSISKKDAPTIINHEDENAAAEVYASQCRAISEEKYHEDTQFLLEREHELYLLESSLEQKEAKATEELQQLEFQEKQEEERKGQLQEVLELVEKGENDLREDYGLIVDKIEGDSGMAMHVTGSTLEDNEGESEEDCYQSEQEVETDGEETDEYNEEEDDYIESEEESEDLEEESDEEGSDVESEDDAGEEDNDSVSSYEQQLAVLREAAAQHQRIREQARIEGFQLLHKLEQKKRHAHKRDSSIDEEEASTGQENEEVAIEYDLDDLERFAEYLNKEEAGLARKQENLKLREDALLEREKQQRAKEIHYFRQNLQHGELIEWDFEHYEREKDLADREQKLLDLMNEMKVRKEKLYYEKSANDELERELNERKHNIDILSFVLDLRCEHKEMMKLKGVPYEKPIVSRVDEPTGKGDGSKSFPAIEDLQGEYEMIFYYNELPSCCDSELERCRTTSGSLTLSSEERNSKDLDESNNYIAEIFSDSDFPHVYFDRCNISSFGTPKECWAKCGAGEAFLHVLSEKQALHFCPDSGLQGSFPAPFSSTTIKESETFLERYNDTNTSWSCHHDISLPADVAFKIREFVCPPPVFFLEARDLCISIKDEDGCSGAVIFARRKK